MRIALPTRYLFAGAALCALMLGLAVPRPVMVISFRYLNAYWSRFIVRFN